MRSRNALLVGLLLTAWSWAEAQRQAFTDSLFSPSLGRTKRFMVLLPQPLESGKRYPVLYLLHGHGGNYTNWASQAGFDTLTARYPLIIVMPDGENSWYANAAGDSTARFEDYIANDLQAAVHLRYPVDTMRQAVAGLSMGGYGALIQAFRHSWKYLFAGSMSGSVNVPGDIEGRARIPELVPTVDGLRRVFGDSTNPARKTYSLANFVSRVSPDSLPYIYVAAGIQDTILGRLRGHRGLARLLSERGIAYEYHETPGKHEWRYWIDEIRPLLERCTEIFRMGFRSAGLTLQSVAATEGFGEAIRRIPVLRADPSFNFREDEMLAFGDAAIRNGKIPEAISIYGILAAAYPASAGAYRGAADAYRIAGDRERAVLWYGRLLVLDPGNAYAIEQLRLLGVSPQ